MRWSARSLAVAVGVLALVTPATSIAGRVDLQSPSGLVAKSHIPGQEDWPVYLDLNGRIWQQLYSGWIELDIPGYGWPVAVSEMEYWTMLAILTTDGVGWRIGTYGPGDWTNMGAYPGYPIGVPSSPPASGERGLAVPNPFAQSTRIDFETGQALRDAAVSIYSTDGRLVREIRVGTVAVDHFAVTWDGRDADGGLVAPGVYLATLRADDGFEATAKVTLAP